MIDRDHRNNRRARGRSPGRPPSPFQEVAVCALDGLPTGQHQRCVECDILIGSAHVEWERDDAGLCSACRDFRAQVTDRPDSTELRHAS